MGKKNRKRDFFKEDSPHGLVKRLMFKKYFQAYIAKTQNEKFTLNTVVIDAFAGEGRYGNDWPEEIEKYGSPLIAEMVALEFCYRRDVKAQKKCNEGKEELEKVIRNIHLGKEAAELSSDSSPESSEENTEGNHEDLTGLDTACMIPGKTYKDNIWGWPDSDLDSEAELAVELKTKSLRKEYFSRNAKITLIFIESDQNKHQKLAANVELLLIKFLKSHFPTYQYGFSQQEGKIKLIIDAGVFSLKIKVINNRFVDTTAPKMLQDQSVRSLTFLDPYGFKDTPMSHIQQFVPGTGNEILINFMSSFVNRFVSRCPEYVAQLYGIDVHDQENEVGLAEFVQNILRFRQPQRKNEFSNNINICTSNYEEFLKRKTECKYSLTFEIKDKRNTTLFHMVHITNHIRGVEAMKESMNRCSQKEGEMVMSDYDIVRKGQTLNFGNIDDPNKVAEIILMKFRGEKRVTLDRINDYILMETKYLFRKSPLKILQKSGKMTVERADGKVQKVMFTFPKEDKESKRSITWLLSFEDEDYGNEATNNLETDDKKTSVTVNSTKKKPKQVKGRCDKLPDACQKKKKTVLGGKAEENKKCKQMTERLDTNTNAAESLPVGQRVMTSYYRTEKENKIEKSSLKQERKRERKRKLSCQSSKNETAPKKKNTLYNYFKVQGSE